MARRTHEARLAAISDATARREDFLRRLADAGGDVIRLSDLMAEAIAMDSEARGLETVGRDGRALVCVESIFAAHCMDAARAAYLRARGANHG